MVDARKSKGLLLHWQPFSVYEANKLRADGTEAAGQTAASFIFRRIETRYQTCDLSQRQAARPAFQISG
jgi:hypothetical protein